jgi:cytochrome c oxidase subunit 2
VASAHDTAHKFSDLFGTYLVVTIAAVVVVFIAVGVTLLLFTDRTGRDPRPSGERRVVLTGYALMLAVIAVVLISATFATEGDIDSTSAAPAATVSVVASQWRWTFTYPGHPGVTTVDQLDVPRGQVVLFRLRSADVIHSMWFVAQRFKRYATPGSPTSFELTFARSGTFRGECSQFCGIGHDHMRFTVHVVSPGAYRKWLAQ